ncbi:MAG: ATP-binding protein [Micrococcales bacterium]|nr:ATP-binding protein [Micrococcales bacterium]
MLALFVLVSLFSGFATLLTLQNSLQADLDQRVITQSGRFRPNDGDVFGPPGTPPGLGGDFLLLMVTNGVAQQNVVYTRAGAATRLTTSQMRALAAATLSSRPQTIDLGDQLGRYRLVAADQGDSHIVTGLPTARLDQSLDQLRGLVVGLGVTGLVLLGAGATWLIRSSLRPLERVAATATRISTLPLATGEVTLVERVPFADTDARTEVGQVGAALNDLIDHVDSALNARYDSEQRLRRFVADASHELRTPLASIRGYAELSHREREPVPETVRHALNRIESEAGRMSTLVEDLLLLARLDSGRPLESEPVDLTRLLLDAVSDAQVAGRDHTWRLDLPKEAVEVVGDEARLTQVIVNLLANTRVHTPPGTTVTGRLRRVALGPGSRPDAGPQVVLEVEDDGPGIHAGLLPHIFGRFTRGDSARVRSSGSTGLGLSIVQAVARAHGGDVTVASAPGRTIFRVTLPAA